MIDRCLEAYTMVISPKSCIKLSTIVMGNNGERGFAIHARRTIQKNEVIHELIGMMPLDNDTPHSRLSEITPHPVHNQSHEDPRILFGPIRFINHLCLHFNAEVCI